MVYCTGTVITIKNAESEFLDVITFFIPHWESYHMSFSITMAEGGWFVRDRRCLYKDDSLGLISHTYTHRRRRSVPTFFDLKRWATFGIFLVGIISAAVELPGPQYLVDLIHAS